ncbi:SRPBCC family protein [Ornithinimicrobium sp. F0845]|uniref:SRPBCC family protein n=1 Tax=Ornithinimicrobium sp. F0845 TaxID=2926412 RepID=UPI001FF39628|nr:SRPBCC family protein [Ornithinimicrobium sp. F0845]MCK0112122.1 SRPBCC family protein [Ornithinimicrobium sp. F0845]
MTEATEGTTTEAEKEGTTTQTESEGTTTQGATTESRLGTVLREGDTVGLRYERHLSHPPEKVWAALTESEHLHHWFPADIVGERRAGAEVQLPFWPETAESAAEELEQQGIDLDDPVLPGRILEWDPPRLFVLEWGNARADADLLRFELTPLDDGTRLVFTTWLGTRGPHGHEGTGAGYQVCLGLLEQLLDGDAPTTPGPEEVQELERQYAERLA